MSLLVASPIYGQAFVPYMISMMRLQEALILGQLKHDFLFIQGESLVHRARNNAVTSFLETDFERFLFVDADLEFDPTDVEKLWNLDEDVCCASYPMKQPGIKTTAWKGNELVDLDKLDGPTEIDLAATGFLMVKRHVFTGMRDEYPHLKHMEGLPQGNFEDRRESFSWFDPHVTGEEDYRKRVTLSEDYAFSEAWRRMGGKIILEPSIRLRHWGFMGYE